jgi:nucleoside-diphosphate-sugar epimerase
MQPVRVFLAGATGVLGVRLLPLLVGAGHDVAGMTRTRDKAASVRELGGEPIVCDVYDLDALSRAIAGFRPDLVLHQLTALPDDPAEIDDHAAANARIRREGTRKLVTAASAAGVGGLVAQSVAWEIGGDGGEAVREHERTVLDAGGVVVRYGRLYGPGTYFETEPPPPPRVHVDEAARRTLPALDAPTGILVIAEA